MGRRAVQQNYLRTLANGAVALIFPGGVQLQADTSGAIPSDAKSLTWVNSLGHVVAAIGESYNDLGFGGTSQLVLQAVEDNSVHGIQAAVVLRAGHGAIGGVNSNDSELSVGVDSPYANANKWAHAQVGPHGAYILKGDGTSSFQQWDSPQPYLTRFFSLSIGALPAGAETAANIAIPWTAAIYLVGGLVGTFNAAQGQLCTWCYDPNAPGNVVVTIRNNSPFGMAGGTVLQGEARYI